MEFGDLKVRAGQQALNNYLADKSYLVGFFPTQSDNTVFAAMGVAPPGDLFHALRWFNHISSFSEAERAAFPAASGSSAATPAAAPATAPVAKKTDDDDDFDMFGDEEEDEEAAKRNAERVAAYQAKKAASSKPAVIAKSSVLLDCKPWDDETNMKELEEKVRTIEMDGLVWGQSKLVPVAYGLKKLQIGCVIEDDKVSTEILEEKILEFEDHCQSVDIAAFNKI